MILFNFLFFVCTLSFANLLKSIQQSQVIFITEEHTNMEDHRFQLYIIRMLSNSNIRFVIAMEMFQTPFQKVLDDYIACRIEEEEMLEKTQYRKRWGYDPKLYRDIWLFAKERGIRIYAINIPSELVSRIREEGLSKVRDENLPYPVVEQTQEEKERLKEFLKDHPKANEKTFLEIQNAWDNGMALSIARILEENPGVKVVVFVGRGHAENYQMGIPRVLRRLKPDVKMLILDRKNYKDLRFSMDFSMESSSANSSAEPNCKP